MKKEENKFKFSLISEDKEKSIIYKSFCKDECCIPIEKENIKSKEKLESRVMSNSFKS